MTIEFVMLLQDMLGDLEGNPEPVEVKIFGDDLTTLAALAERTAARLEKIPGLVDIVVPQRGNPELNVRIDPTRAAKAGIHRRAGDEPARHRPARPGADVVPPRRPPDRRARAVRRIAADSTSTGSGSSR